ncbi:hypothetical protein EDB19DRAFT_13964 [Suillus lakei]|nr:hypothetical protein EDB19DRAFT_13964 [Suillus lakei]
MHSECQACTRQTTSKHLSSAESTHACGMILKFRMIGLWQLESKSRRVSCNLSVPPIMSNTLVSTGNTNVFLSTRNEGVAQSVDRKRARHESVDRDRMRRVSLDRQREHPAFVDYERARRASIDREGQRSCILLTASDSVANLLIANGSVVLSSTGDTIFAFQSVVSTTCRLDIMAIMNLFLGRFPVHQCMLSPASLLPQVPNLVIVNLSLNLWCPPVHQPVLSPSNLLPRDLNLIMVHLILDLWHFPVHQSVQSLSSLLPRVADLAIPVVLHSTTRLLMTTLLNPSIPFMFYLYLLRLPGYIYLRHNVIVPRWKRFVAFLSGALRSLCSKSPPSRRG